MFRKLLGLIAALVLFTTGASFADEPGELKHVKKFVRFTDCEFLETAYADGDSFKVRVDGTGESLPEHQRCAKKPAQGSALGKPRPMDKALKGRDNVCRPSGALSLLGHLHPGRWPELACGRAYGPQRPAPPSAGRGAWEFSVPAKAKPVVEQVKEGAEPANWLERAEFTGLGAGAMGALLGFSSWRGRRKGISSEAASI